MNIIASVRIAFQSLASNKLRAGLTMLGIIIGVGAVVALVAAGAGAEAQVTERFRSLGSNLLVISPRMTFVRRSTGQAGFQAGFSARMLSNADVDAIRRLARYVAAVAPQYSTQASVVYGSASTQVSVLGVTPEYLTVGNWKLARGRYISEFDLVSRDKVAVLGSAVVEDLFGDTLVDALGQTIKINRQNYQVVGILASKGVGGFQNLDNQVFIPLTTAQIKFGGAGNTSVQSINVQVVSADKIEIAKAELTTILRARHGLVGTQADDFTIRDQTQLVEMVAQNVQTFTVLLGSIAAISLVVGGIGIMNIMLVSVTERTREIGLRKAVGAKRRDILIQFLTEAIVLSLVGGVLGVLAGYGGARIVTPLLGANRAIVTPDSIIMALSTSIGVGLFFGLYPAYRAARLNPIEALRYE